MSRPGEDLVSREIDRRTFLGGLAGVGIAIGTGGRLLGAGGRRIGATPALPADPFQLGVASGDPLPDSVVLWTRLAVDPLSPEPMPPVRVPVRWEIASDERFRKVVRSGQRTTGPDVGHSVHVDAHGLDAGHDYFYRFHVGDYVSPTGRTRTAPDPGRLSSLTFGVTSCQSYQAGYYTAYEQMSRDDLAFVVFLGDYIYELPGGSVRSHGIPPSVTIDDFRRHYAAHHADPQLQAAHAAAPWIMTWDDHEVEDNYAGLHPGELGKTRDPEGSSNFAAKRAAAYRAWWENVPVRAKPPGSDGSMRIYRSFRFGDLVTLPVVDDRQYRTPLATEGQGPASPPGGYPLLPAALDPNATILGKEQERWLQRTLDRSDARWNVLAQQTQMAAVDQTPEDASSSGFSADAWDGYVEARNRLLGHVENAKVKNFVTLGGDTHTSSVDDLRSDFQKDSSPVVGTEFVAPPATSLENLAPQYVEGALRNPWIHLYDITNKGYLRVEATRAQLRAEFRYVTTTQQPQAAPMAGTSWTVESGKPGAQQV